MYRESDTAVTTTGRYGTIRPAHGRNPGPVIACDSSVLGVDAEPTARVDAALRCAWGFADLSSLLKLLSQAVDLGWVTEATRPAGHFAWNEPHDLEPLFAQATAQDWMAVFDALDVASWGLASAREAAQAGNLPRARLLYWALVVGLRAHPELFDGARWLEVVMEALRLFRREVNWLSEDVQADALELAVRLGGRASRVSAARDSGLRVLAMRPLRGGFRMVRSRAGGVGSFGRSRDPTARAVVRSEQLDLAGTSGRSTFDAGILSGRHSTGPASRSATICDTRYPCRGVVLHAGQSLRLDR